MNKHAALLVVIVSALSVFGPTRDALAQCDLMGPSGETFDAASLSLGTRTTTPAIELGEFLTVANLTVGYTYVFDSCGCADDSEITLFPPEGSGNTGFAFDTSSCSDDGSYEWVATMTSIRLQLNWTGCGYYSGPTTALGVTLVALPVTLQSLTVE